MAQSENPRVTQAVDAAKAIRETLKWLTAALAAVAAVLLAGMQISRIGTLRCWRLGAAVAAALISLGSVVWALSSVLGVLLPVEANVADAPERYREKLSKLLEDLGKPGASVKSVFDAFNQNTKRREETAKKLAETSDLRERDQLLHEDQILADNEQSYREVLDGAAATLACWELRDKFMGSRTTLYICAGVAAVGILFFVYVSSSGSVASASLTGTSLTLNLGRFGDLVANPVLQRISEPIEPFKSGTIDRLEKQSGSKIQDICESSEVKAVIEKAKDKQLRLLVVIGSADKFELAQPLKSIYGSNDGLAQGRADQILRCISKAVTSQVSVTSIRGPSVHGSSASRVDTRPDRSVSVYGVW